MPTPIRHGGEGDALLIIGGVTLQSGHIDGGGKMAVAYCERCEIVGFGDDGVVTKKNSLAINRGCCIVGIETKHFHFK